MGVIGLGSHIGIRVRGHGFMIQTLQPNFRIKELMREKIGLLENQIYEGLYKLKRLMRRGVIRRGVVTDLCGR